MLARSAGKVFNRVATAYDRHRPAYPDQLIALARRNLHGSGAVEFVNARFEDVTLPRGQFTAVLSASAIH